MENELHTFKEVKKWGGSLIVRFSPDEIKILNLNHGDIGEMRFLVKKRLNQNQKSEKEVHEKMQQQTEEYQEGETSEEEEDSEEDEDLIDEDQSEDEE